MPPAAGRPCRTASALASLAAQGEDPIDDLLVLGLGALDLVEIALPLVGAYRRAQPRQRRRDLGARRAHFVGEALVAREQEPA